MLTEDDAALILRMTRCGWGAKRIARELGVSKNTVRRYRRLGGWKPREASARPARLDEHRAWLEAAFKKHRGNAAVVRDELEAQLGVSASLRAVQRAVKDLRRGLELEARATVRFETEPGEQL